MQRTSGEMSSPREMISLRGSSTALPVGCKRLSLEWLMLSPSLRQCYYCGAGLRRPSAEQVAQLFRWLMLKPGLTGWREQYDRMMRAYERLQQPVWSSIAYYDDLHHFFQDCWHLKDWIKNDTAAGVDKK